MSMNTSLILAVVFVPVALLLVFFGLIIAWFHMRHKSREDVVDLVALQKEPQLPVLVENDISPRISTEPFPQLPSMGLDPPGSLMGTTDFRTEGRNYGDLQRPGSAQSVHTGGRTTPYARETLKQSNSLIESPSREALGAFEFDTPSKPPLPARSLKRNSGIINSPVTTTPTIKIEPASPSNNSETSNTIQPIPIHLSPTITGRRHTRKPLESKDITDTDEIKPIPFSSVPITHIANPTADSLPQPPSPQSIARTLAHNASTRFLPKDAAGMQALKANREMMEIEAWRPDLQKKLAENTLDLSPYKKQQKWGGVSMHGKRNSAIREYVKGFPEENPWRKIMSRMSREAVVDVEKQREVEKGQAEKDEECM